MDAPPRARSAVHITTEEDGRAVGGIIAYKLAQLTEFGSNTNLQHVILVVLASRWVCRVLPGCGFLSLTILGVPFSCDLENMFSGTWSAKPILQF